MKRFVLNTAYNQAGARIWIHELAANLQKQGIPARVNDWDHYRDYDVALFTPYDSDIDKAKAQNPNILIGLVDPKTADISQVKKSDFLIVSSLEQRDLFLKFHSQCFIFYPFPNTPRIERQHSQKSKIILGYHGNKVHLNAFYPHLTRALETLGQKYDLELWAVYDKKNLGQWKIGCPRDEFVKVKHIQWSNENMDAALNQIDIGLVPAVLPVRNESSLKKRSVYSKRAYLNDSNDYLVRFKYSTNPGRLYVFAKSGIPVVAGMFPSASQFIFDGKSGYVAHSAEGWHAALENLIRDPLLRQSMADTLRQTIESHAGPEKLAAQLAAYVERLTPAQKEQSSSARKMSPSSRTRFRIELVQDYLDSYLYPKLKKALKK